MNQFGTAAASPPATNPPQRQWLVAFGIFEILIACFFLLMALMAATVLANAPRPAGQPPMPGGMFYMVAGFYLAIAAFFVTVGMGSIRAKNWARIAMIVASSLWLALGVFSTIVTLFVMPAVMRQLPPPRSGQLPPNFQTTVIIISAVFEIFTMVLLPLVFLLFYRSKGVKAACHDQITPAAAGQRPPIPIIVVALWFGIVGLGGLVAATWFPMTVVFGYFLTGVPARLVGLTFFSVSAYCAWGMFERRPHAWLVATAASAVWLLSGLMTWTRMDAPTMYAKTYEQMGMNPQQMATFTPQTMAVFWFLGLLVSFAFFVLVLYTRRYFSRPQKTLPHG